VREYTLAAAAGVALAVALETAVLRTGMFRDRRYWVTLAIVAGFELIVDGVLTCPPIVAYDPRRILGLRVACAPVEDLAFGFAMVTVTLNLWRWTGRRPRRPHGPPRR
jgi:lycopene cyclase domain-containing protein